MENECFNSTGGTLQSQTDDNVKEPKMDTAEAFSEELSNGIEKTLRKPLTDPAEMRVKDDPDNKEHNGTDQQNGQVQPIGELVVDTAALLHRTMEALYEMNPDLENSHEEIRKLDTQLDHLNEYMDRVEVRIKEHNDKLLETLKQQKEDRDKRRQSFHERTEINRQEEENFQKQLNSIMHRVDSSRGENPVEEEKTGNSTSNNN